MKQESITRFNLNPKKPPKTDWRAFDAMSEEGAIVPLFQTQMLRPRPRRSSRALATCRLCGHCALG